MGLRFWKAAMVLPLILMLAGCGSVITQDERENVPEPLMPPGERVGQPDPEEVGQPGEIQRNVYGGGNMQQFEGAEGQTGSTAQPGPVQGATGPGRTQESTAGASGSTHQPRRQTHTYSEDR